MLTVALPGHSLQTGQTRLGLFLPFRGLPGHHSELTERAASSVCTEVLAARLSLWVLRLWVQRGRN